MRRSAALAGISALTTIAAWAPEAHAYPWMIRHAYVNCAQCHIDPSGAGALTSYGRSLGEQELPSVYGERGADWTPGKAGEFLFGAFKLPKALTLQFDTRHLVIPEPSNFRWIAMQNDLRAGLDLGPVIAYASAGWVSEGGQGAWVTSNTGTGGNLVSREHWVGVKPTKNLLFRAGRMNLPFGIRTEEHVLYTRSATRTDTNDDQQLGVSALWNAKKLRAEVMGIAGNFSVSPDDFRERGYSGYVAFAVSKKAEVGVSSLVTTAKEDVETLAQRTRQAHGVFTRVGIVPQVGVLAEADVLHDSTDGEDPRTGLAATLQLETEPVQGFHVKGTGEFCDDQFSDDTPGVASEWLTTQWFFTSHADVRLDGIHGVLNCTPGVDPQWMGLAQVHLFL